MVSQKIKSVIKGLDLLLPEIKSSSGYQVFKSIKRELKDAAGQLDELEARLLVPGGKG